MLVYRLAVDEYQEQRRLQLFVESRGQEKAWLGDGLKLRHAPIADCRLTQTTRSGSCLLPKAAVRKMPDSKRLDQTLC